MAPKGVCVAASSISYAFWYSLHCLRALDVAHRELPVLGRVVQAFLQAFALLLSADVQHELEHDGAGVSMRSKSLMCPKRWWCCSCDPAVDCGTSTSS